MSSLGVVVAEVVGTGPYLIVRHRDNEGTAGGHYTVSCLDEATCRQITVTTTLIGLRRLAWDLEQEIKRAADGGT